MPEPYWGVDSFNRADFRPPGEPEATLYEYVRNRVRAPDFWGRYLGRASSQITAAETEFLQARNCRIALVYNAITSAQCRARRQAGWRNGMLAAKRACMLAEGVGVPAGVRIYADLENWWASTEFLQGWWQTMHLSKFAGMGGLYGRGAELSRPWEHGPSWHRRWSRSASAAAEEQDERLLPGDLDAIATGEMGPVRSRFVWSNMPRTSGDPRPGEEVIPSTFRPVGPSSDLMTTVIWQYRLMCYRARGAPQRALIDMDLATEAGFREMWAVSRGAGTTRVPTRRRGYRLV